MKQVRQENIESSFEKGQGEATENDEEREMDFEAFSVMDDIEESMNEEGYMKSTMMSNASMCRQIALALLQLGP